MTKIDHVDAVTSKVILTKLLADHSIEDVTLVVMLNAARFDRATLGEMIPDRDWSRAPTGPKAASDEATERPSADAEAT